MRRIPTNFGPYEREYQARVSLTRRILKAVVQLILTAAVVALAGTFLFPLNAHAGGSCEQANPEATTVMKSVRLAERTAQQLDASGARGMPRTGLGAAPVVLKLWTRIRTS